MKKIYTFFLVFLCAHAMGQQVSFLEGGIVYGITSETERTVEVQPYYNLLDNPYSGTITIPQTVDYNGATYTVTALGESAFENCGNVSSLTLPATVRSIGPYCFYNCNFTSLQLPDSLRTLGDHAFLYSRISSLHLPVHFEEYGSAAFWARNLTSITVDEDNPLYRSINGWLFSKDSLTLCIVPDGVTGTIEVPSYVRHIGMQAFGFNSMATSVSLPEGLISIGDFAFNCCSAVNNVIIPSTVTSIGICPFSYCPQLTNLTIASGNSHYVMDGLMLYSSDYDTLVSCHKSGTTVTINPNVKVLGGFENNSWVRNIDIPSGVTDILDNCFSGCSFSTIALPEHMKSIGAHAFSENSHLASVTMPRTLLTMGTGAFAWCEGLTSIVIPDSLRVIPKEAFNSCPRLRTITWGNAVEEIGYAAFWAMSAAHLDLPATLKKLDDLAFAACSNNLRTVTLHSQLDTMGEAVFRHANLNRIRFYAAAPPTVTGEGPLYDMGRLDSIVVPCGSLDAWLADSYWGQFANKYKEDCNGIAGIQDDGISVYPNPARGRMEVTGIDNCSHLELVNMLGVTVLSQKVAGSTIEIDVSRLARGTYLLRLHSADGIASKRLIVQ
ncbi:MAG: leucine-rich repeat domain-containing protein [Bacteroidales bacterium]|nr:leucine-rich repeat domain-containing protein [Bacteroidales bacterium]